LFDVHPQDVWSTKVGWQSASACLFWVAGSWSVCVVHRVAVKRVLPFNGGIACLHSCRKGCCQSRQASSTGDILGPWWDAPQRCRQCTGSLPEVAHVVVSLCILAMTGVSTLCVVVAPRHQGWGLPVCSRLCCGSCCCNRLAQLQPTQQMRHCWWFRTAGQMADSRPGQGLRGCWRHLAQLASILYMPSPLVLGVT
jgi:hypothetical protein